jgi:fatty-acyl-CoA synthase
MNAAPITASANATEVSSSTEWLRALELTKSLGNQSSRVLPLIIDDLARSRGDEPALLSDRECLSFRALAQRSNRYAHWALEQDLAKAEAVCLLMPNRPEYMAIWLGITRVGGVVALLNTNLAGPPLAHCIDTVRAKHIIVARELMEKFIDAQRHLTTQPKVWCHGDGADGIPNVEDVLGRLSGEPVSDADCEPPGVSDRALLIYTSGTTGLPKAANVSHYRLLIWSFWFAGMMNSRSSDRMYNCLPMYHSIGGVVATGAVLVNGGSVVIREKFSASQFWDDIARWDCTLFQYIGELCRYLVLAAPHARERAHRIRLCCGNGLRGDIWTRFKQRFQIPSILEFYAATEGNVTLFNCEGKPGAIGRIPPFLAHRSSTALVKHDVETGEVARTDQGYCIRCLPDEIGEAIGKISNHASDLNAQFEGYTNSRDSEKKILRNVFEAGDAWFRTGDLMRKDKSGFFYFVDRVGDTFRWKGENVSTAEVSEAITSFPGVTDANVYGVQVPGTEGRAGMAAIVVDERFKLAGLRRHLAKWLPAYAQPLFLRLVREIELTETFKQRKVDLAREGYNPCAVHDIIYFNDRTRNAFVRLNEALFHRIQARQVRI